MSENDGKKEQNWSLTPEKGENFKIRDENQPNDSKMSYCTFGASGISTVC